MSAAKLLSTPAQRRWGALWIVGLYLVIGGLWIAFSDRVIEAASSSTSMLATLSTLKGWGYIAVTALFGLANSSNSFLILRAKGIGIPLQTTILIYAGFNLMAALSSFPAGTLSDRWGRKSLLLFSFLIYIAGVVSGRLLTDWTLQFLETGPFFWIQNLLVAYGPLFIIGSAGAVTALIHRKKSGYRLYMILAAWTLGYLV
ncbi:MAG: hypothetical protein M1482_03210, partial [Chloroflexi bacterium]|nr:hypothetical protein [Chloroflexota bacterium]